MSDAVPVMTIDGPSGAGKGTVARRVARLLGWHLLDSGALYRLTALAAWRRGIATDAGPELAEMMGHVTLRFGADEADSECIYMDDEEVSRLIRTERCGEMASQVASQPELRSALVDLQRGFRKPPGLVADGRDMGTVIFPDASAKVFLTADPGERARRRHKQLKEKGVDVSLAALFDEIEARDRRDATREVAPLVPAEDAVVLDTTGLDIDQVVERLREIAEENKLVAGA